MLASYFVDRDNMILQFKWKGKTPKIANTILKDKVRGLILPDFQIYKEAAIIKIMCHWQIDNWKRREHSEINPHKYSQLVFDKVAKAIQ